MRGIEVGRASPLRVMPVITPPTIYIRVSTVTVGNAVPLAGTVTALIVEPVDLTAGTVISPVTASVESNVVAPVTARVLDRLVAPSTPSVPASVASPLPSSRVLPPWVVRWPVEVAGSLSGAVSVASTGGCRGKLLIPDNSLS